MDQDKMMQFLERVSVDQGGANATLLGYLGDRLGLWATLADAGPATSEELATRTGMAERYLREWLSASVVAGYLDYEPASQRFTLSAERAAVLADPQSPAFQGGGFEALVAVPSLLDHWERTGVWHQQWLTLRLLAEALTATGAAEPAAELLGAFDVSNTAGPVYGDDVVRLDRVREQLTASLGAARLEAVTARGAVGGDQHAVLVARATLGVRRQSAMMLYRSS